MLNTFIAVLMVVAQIMPMSAGPVPDVTASPARASIEFIDLPADQVEIATWAIGLYEEAGLALPAIRFVYHGDDTEACGGWFGSHEVTTDASVIRICTSRTSPPTEAMFVHELAHAWCAHSLSDEHRNDFLEMRDCPVWRGDVPWHERGAEHAAEILMWGLVDRPTGVITIRDHGCDALEAGYRTLTGETPLHGYCDHC